MFQCAVCNKCFKHKKSLLPHLKKHGDPSTSTRTTRSTCRIKCAVCRFPFSQHDLYRNHLVNQHSITIGKEEFSFVDDAEFQVWKKKLEKSHLCHYTRTYTARTKNNTVRSVFICHRSGFFLSKSKGKREMKSIGTNKIDATCPSMMVVTKTLCSVTVIFWSTHVGHSSNLGRCYLTKEERTAIADKMRAGVTLDKILDDIRDNVVDINDPIVLTTKHTLRNIKQSFGIFNGREHPSDAVSLRLWVNSMSKLNERDNPIVFYKPQGDEHTSFAAEDFILIISTDFQKTMLKDLGIDKVCIDSTHGTNSYDFHLTTLMVIDEFGGGYPCAFCISNRKDTEMWKLFFEELKKHVGSIKAKTFMSDDDQSFYNAWSAVMGPVQHQLTCSWHVDKAWRKNINTKVRGTEKKAMVYKVLKVLQGELNENTFENLLQTAADQFLADEDTADFGHYFISYYLHRSEMWAFCKRKGCGINTNMHLESMHKCLKHFYLHGKKNRRVDKSINVILKLSRDKLFDRYSKFAKKVMPKRKEIRFRHLASLQIAPTNLIKITDGTWEVHSTNTEGVVYEVSRLQEQCNGDCPSRCVACYACLHKYQCNCPDFIIKSVTCKHIHAVALLDLSTVPNFHTKPQHDKLINVQTAIISKNEMGCEKERLLKLIKNKCETLPMILASASSTYTVEHLEKMNKALDSLLTLAAANEPQCPIEPANKNISKQMRLYSTKKKRTCSNPSTSLSAPTVSQRINIIESLKEPNEEIVNIHTAFDHTYVL